MVNRSKYIDPDTTTIRVPRAIAIDVISFALSLDKARWVEGCVFTLGPYYKHDSAIKKLTKVKR